MKFSGLHRLIILFFVVCVLGFPAKSEGALSQSMIEPHAQAMPLMPFLDYILDPNVGMSIEEVAALNGWAPFDLDKLPASEGILWLRFTIAPLASDARPQTFLLDMGQSVPGKPLLYEPVINPLSDALEWRSIPSGERNIFLLPEASSQAISYYICLQGFPGPWFDPMIRSPQNAASNWGSLARTGAILALAVVMGLCFLRGLGEKGEWRYWTALFVALSLIQAWVGMPTVQTGLNIWNLLAILTPGLAILCLGHAGRHLLRHQSRLLDIQLFILSLSGAVLAILPLVKGFQWLERWLDLWPLATCIFIPTALWAWLKGLEGARRFLIACIVPPLCTGIGLIGLDFGLPANILASFPSWGVGLAALFLAATPAVAVASHKKESDTSKKSKSSLGSQYPLPEIEMDASEPLPGEKKGDEDIIVLEHPLDDPNLRLLPAPLAEEPIQSKQESNESLEPFEKEYCPALVANVDTRLEDRENAIREPLDVLVRETNGLLNCSLPPSAREFAERITVAAQKLSQIMSSSESSREELDFEEKIFNLQHILRSAHDSVATAAEYSGTALSWYMPPHLPQIYEGPANGLEAILSMLMESALRSSKKGAIKLSAKRVPDSSDAGFLLFTVSDDGKGFPPVNRSSLALVRAWELTGRYGGYLSVESSFHGSTISFTAHFAVVEDESQVTMSQKNPCVIVVSDNQENRKRIARILAPLDIQINEADSEPEVVAIQEHKGAALLITQEKFARPAAADMIRRVVNSARKSGVKCFALALTQDNQEWGLLKASGFTHAMLEPVDAEALRSTVAELLNINPNGNASFSEPVYGASATLVEPIKVGDKAPVMLIDHTNPIEGPFEGPDWLKENDSNPEANEATSSEERTDKNPPTKIQKEQEDKSRENKSKESVRENGFNFNSPKISHENAHQYKAPPDAMEWVGEPMPIVPDSERSSEEATEKKDMGLMDLIVGVKEEKPKKEESKVKEFAAESAGMIANTITGILNKSSYGRKSEKGPIERNADPTIATLVEKLDAAIKQANYAFQKQDAASVSEFTGIIAEEAENFGLRLLARMARCVERAAKAPDMNAVGDLLPELDNAVERNRITLLQKKPLS